MGVLKYVVLLAAVAGICSAYPDHAATIRPPSYPLAVRAPYSNVWLHASSLPGKWPGFWTGGTKGWTGMVRVDGKTYTWMGNPLANDRPVADLAVQDATVITPTQTHFIFTAGPVQVNVTFFSPVELEDIERQSIPLSYVFVTVEPKDGNSHEVQLYMDITAEWASGDASQQAKWGLTRSTLSDLKIWTTEMANPIKFAEVSDYPQWGQAVLVTSGNAQHQSGEDTIVRTAFATNGALDNSNDENFRPISQKWPTFAFTHDLGNLSRISNTIQYVVGQIREESINLRETPQKALWTHYFNSQQDMIDFFYNDVATAMSRATALDIKLLDESFAAGGQDYADIVTMSLRQAVAGTEFSGNKTHPLLYQKEISSNGNMQTVDVMYPAVPMWWHLNVDYLRYLLEPLFYQMELGYWNEDFSIHDIGFHYPNATGHDEGVGTSEDMPCEESANMILMVSSIVFHPSKDAAEEQIYVRRHYRTLSKWAMYLYSNCLYPVNQLTTDDFIGHTELNSGLALKSILGMKAFAKIATLVEESQDAVFYNEATTSYIKTWFNESFVLDQDYTPHLKMEYNKDDGYQFKYNAYFDKQLNLQTVPEGVYSMEANYYLSKAEPYGIRFVSTHDYTKSDWEVWTAAAFGDANPELKSTIIKGLAKYLRETPSRVPFSDWYNTASGNQVGFQARPVAGGHFAIIALNQIAA